MVLELLEGPSLADWLGTFGDGHLPELPDVMWICFCRSAPAWPLHQIQNLVRSPPRLKPENVMLIPTSKQQPSGLTAKLLDFGITRFGEPAPYCCRPAAGYAALWRWSKRWDEQAMGPWSDVFALGVMLVEMLTLHPTGLMSPPLRGALVRNGPRGLRE